MREFDSFGNTFSVVLSALVGVVITLALLPFTVSGQLGPTTTQIYDAFAYEALSVSTVVLGFTPATFAPSSAAQVQRAVCTTETNSLRYRYDGSDPSSTEGHLVAAPGSFTIHGARNIGRFRTVRVSGDAALKCTFER